MVDAYDQLLSKLDSSTSGAVFWEPSLLQVAIADAQYELASRHLGGSYATSTLTCSAGEPLAELPWTDIMIPQHLYTLEGVQVWPVELAALEDWSSRWRNAPAGKPKFVVAWDWNHVVVWPTPDATYEYLVGGRGWPVAIDNHHSSQAPEGQLFQDALTSIAAAQLLAFTQPQLAMQERQHAEQALARFAKQQRHAGGWNTIRLRPGTAWSLAPGGSISYGRKLH